MGSSFFFLLLLFFSLAFDHQEIEYMHFPSWGLRKIVWLLHRIEQFLKVERTLMAFFMILSNMQNV
jgi:hypothetical protein